MTPEQTEHFNKSLRSGPGYNKNSLDKGVNLKHLPVEPCIDAIVACKSTMAQKKEDLEQLLYPWEVQFVTQCHTWDLLEKIICGDRNIHAPAIMEIWETIIAESERATASHQMKVRLGTVKTRLDAGSHCSFLSWDKGEIVCMDSHCLV